MWLSVGRLRDHDIDRHLARWDLSVEVDHAAEHTRGQPARCASPPQQDPHAPTRAQAASPPQLGVHQYRGPARRFAQPSVPSSRHWPKPWCYAWGIRARSSRPGTLPLAMGEIPGQQFWPASARVALKRGIASRPRARPSGERARAWYPSTGCPTCWPWSLVRWPMIA